MKVFVLRTSIIFILFAFYGKTNTNPLIGETVKPAETTEFPFIVSLGYFKISRRSEKYFNHFCGGSLITQKHVLTAAHCVEDKKPFDVMVTVGSVDLNEGKLYTIESWITYNDWAEDSAEEHNIVRVVDSNDIAVVVLSRSIPGMLPVVRSNLSDDNIYENKFVTAGWGLLLNNVRTQFLLKVSLRVLTPDECEYYDFKMFGYKVIVSDNQYCSSASKKPSKHPVNLGCGDSGSPLLTKDTKEIVGVNIATCHVDNASTNPYATNLHVKVNYFKEFIDDVSK